MPEHFRHFVATFAEDYIAANYDFFDESVFFQTVPKIFDNTRLKGKRTRTHPPSRRPRPLNKSLQLDDHPLKCPLCEKRIATRSKILQHLSYHHYRGELEARLDPSKPNECPICHKEKKIVFAHLGVVHNVLFEVMPGTVSGRVRSLVD